MSEPAARPGAQLRFTSEGLAWLALTLGLAGLGWYKNLNPMLLLAYAMGVLLVFNGFAARRHARSVTAARVPMPPVFAGEVVRVAIALRNTGRTAVSVGVTDVANWFVDRLPPGATVECDDRRTFATRGRHGAERPVVWSGSPFGFLRCERPGEPGNPVLVLPARGLADPEGMRRWVLRQSSGDSRSRHVQRRATSDQADVRGVRPYRPGDGLRTVHWRSTARHGELMVREYDAAPLPDLVLVVEPWLPANPTDADQLRLEAALSLAATVAWTWNREFSMPVTLLVVGSQPILRTLPLSEPGAREALAPLAEVAGSTEAGEIGPAAFGRSVAGAARLVVSSRPGCPLATTLTRRLGRPFVALDPAQRLPWYQPPLAGEAASGARNT